MLWPLWPVLTLVLMVQESFLLQGLTESNFLQPLNQPQIIFLLSFFPPFPQFLGQKHPFYSPSSIWIEGVKRTNPAHPAELIQRQFNRSMCTEICRRPDLVRAHSPEQFMFLNNDCRDAGRLQALTQLLLQNRMHICLKRAKTALFQEWTIISPCTTSNPLPPINTFCQSSF